MASVSNALPDPDCLTALLEVKQQGFRRVRKSPSVRANLATRQLPTQLGVHPGLGMAKFHGLASGLAQQFHRGILHCRRQEGSRIKMTCVTRSPEPDLRLN